MSGPPHRYASELLPDYYGKFYFETYAFGQAYRADNAHWRSFFAGVVDSIVAELQPRSALDMGCGPGLLVEALRERGVEAWGIDISEYAIERVPEAVRPYCRVASITDELERDYDLIVCIEVIEHLPEHLADAAVGNMTRHAKSVLFSSSPDDFIDPSHQNVKPSEYWIGLFGRHGFYRDLELDASFVTRHAVCLRRLDGSPLSVIRDYERWYSRLSREIREVREVNVGIVADRARLTDEVEELRARLAGRLPALRHSVRSLRRRFPGALGAARRRAGRLPRRS